MSQDRPKWKSWGVILGIAAIAIAFWGGIHLGHLLDEGGGRHAGEVAGFAVVALLLFGASQRRW